MKVKKNQDFFTTMSKIQPIFKSETFKFNLMNSFATLIYTRRNIYIC